MAKYSYAEAKVLDEDGNFITHGTSALMTLPGKGMEVGKKFTGK